MGFTAASQYNALVTSAVRTDPTMLQGMKQIGAGFAIAGALAGATFWQRAGQHYH